MKKAGTVCSVNLLTEERAWLDKMQREGELRTAREEERVKVLKEKEEEKESDDKKRIKKMVRDLLPEAQIIEFSNLPEKEAKRLIKIAAAELMSELTEEKCNSGMSNLNVF